MMRTDLDHLPASIQAEVARATAILFAELAEALRGKQAPHRKAGRILKIILFGSFAREDWREDDCEDAAFDLLVIVNHDELTHPRLWRFAVDRLHRAWTTGALLHPVRLTVHSLAEFNGALADGVPWFVGIADTGIALHQVTTRALAAPRRLPPAEHHARALAAFEQWFPNADTFIMGASFYRRRGLYPMAAVLLHQACEHLYQCVLWTLTLHGRRSHALDELRALAEQQDARLADAWPRATRFERRAFSRVRRAYVEARYTRHYRIEPDELLFAKERTRRLRRLVGLVCREHLDRLAVLVTDAGGRRAYRFVTRRPACRVGGLGMRSEADLRADRKDADAAALDRLAAALETLPPLTCGVYMLSAIDKLCYEEISRRLRITTDEVKVRMMAALCGLDRSMRGDTVPLRGRLRRALLPLRDAWYAARRREGDRGIARWLPPDRRPGRRTLLDWMIVILSV